MPFSNPNPSFIFGSKMVFNLKYAFFSEFSLLLIPCFLRQRLTLPFESLIAGSSLKSCDNYTIWPPLQTSLQNFNIIIIQ